VVNVDILTKQKCHFFHKIRKQEGEHVLPGGLGGCGESMWEGEYGTDTMYICM
jgi:hypothetical protein